MFRMRTTRRKAIAGVGGAAAVLATTAAVALGQVIVPNPPDGSPAGQLPQPNVITHTCGPHQTSIVKTETTPSITSQTGFDLLPGAETHITVPDNQSRCIKVLFTAETACEVTAAPDFCYVRALVDNVPMDPVGGGFQAINSEDGTAEGNAYEWVKRLGEGPHTITIERRVLNGATQFWTDDWTFDVSLHL